MLYYRAEISLPKIENESEFFTYHVDKKNLLSLDISVFDRADTSLPSFGIISNTGKIEFIDNDPNVSISQYANLGLLKDNLNVNVYLVNSQTKKEKKQGFMFTSSWGYNSDTKTVSVSLKDRLQDWQNIDLVMPVYDIFTGATANAYNKFIELSAKAPVSYGERVSIDEKTEEHLKSIPDNIIYFSGGSRWNTWNRFCIATQTHLYSDEEGVVRLVYNGGN